MICRRARNKSYRFVLEFFRFCIRWPHSISLKNEGSQTPCCPQRLVCCVVLERLIGPNADWQISGCSEAWCEEGVGQAFP